MKSIWILLVASAVIGSFVLAACATPGTAPVAPAPTSQGAAPTTQGAAPTTAAPSGEPVTLTFIKIADELEAKAFAEILEEFHKIEGGKYANVNIEYNAKPFAELFPAIENSVATGQNVDLIQADGPDVKHFAWNKVIMDLTDHFTAEEMAQWDPGSIAEGTYQGRFYGPPEVQSCQSLWYNQDMVDAAGLQLGTEGLTYGPDGTGLPVWQKLTKDENGDGNPEVFGFQNNGPFWYDYLNRIPARTNGVPGDATYEGVSPDGLKFVGYFDTDESIEAMQFDQDLFYDYKVRSTEPPTNALLAGFSAMTVSQDLILGTLKDQFPDFNIGAMEPPYWVTPMCQTGSWHYAISPTTQHFDEALAFIKFASSDEGARIMFKYKNQLPANVKLLSELEEFKTYPRDLTVQIFNKYGKPRIETPAYTEYNALFGEYYGSLVAGGDVEQLTKDYAARMEEAAAKYGK